MPHSPRKFPCNPFEAIFSAGGAPQFSPVRKDWVSCQRKTRAPEARHFFVNDAGRGISFFASPA